MNKINRMAETKQGLVSLTFRIRFILFILSNVFFGCPVVEQASLVYVRCTPSSAYSASAEL
jgi:hypothetical protein